MLSTLRELNRLRSLLTHREGIILATGPTGSGKTTTLYGALRDLATEDVNIMTVEDPVEYELPGLTQIQVEQKQNVTFASVLRACLRQDPDIILVGEIRDSETAEVAVHASMTGHLVLSTLHTNEFWSLRIIARPERVCAASSTKRAMRCWLLKTALRHSGCSALRPSISFWPTYTCRPWTASS